MYYDKPMVDMLRFLGEEPAKLFSHYLDNYFVAFEEPEFTSDELKRVWMVLLTHALCVEAGRGEEYSNLAKWQLRKLMNYNAQWYENRALNKNEFLVKTIKKVEGRIKLISVGDKVITVQDIDGETILQLSNEWVDQWKKDHNYYWEKEGLGLSYVLYDMVVDWKYEHVKSKPRREKYQLEDKR